MDKIDIELSKDGGKTFEPLTCETKRDIVLVGGIADGKHYQSNAPLIRVPNTDELTMEDYYESQDVIDGRVVYYFRNSFKVDL